MRIGDKPLKDLSDRELEAELERRRRARGFSGGAVDTPVPRKRSDRRKERDRDRRAARRGRGGVPGWKIRQWYRNLELEPGASRDEVELAYVRLSEKYHPDRQSDADKKELATQLLGGLREAYRGLLETFEDDE